MRTNNKSPLFCTDKEGNSETILTWNSENTVSSSILHINIKDIYA